MSDDRNDGADGFLYFVVFILILTLALYGAAWFSRWRAEQMVARPQLTILPIPTPEPSVLTANTGAAIDVTAPPPELKPSIDLPQSVPDATQADTHAEQSIDASQDTHDLDAGRRRVDDRPRTVHHARRYGHRAQRSQPSTECNPDPGCPGLKGAAQAGGMIPYP